MKRIIPALCLIFLPILSLFSESVTISTVKGLPLSDICSYILKEVYSKAGLDLEVIAMPSFRATLESTSGNTDGETHRIELYATSHPELIRVPFPFYIVETALYTRKGNPIYFNELRDLSGYRFAIHKGIKNSIEKTRGFPYVREFNSTETMFRMLELERIDYLLN